MVVKWAGHPALPYHCIHTSTVCGPFHSRNRDLRCRPGVPTIRQAHERHQHVASNGTTFAVYFRDGQCQRERTYDRAHDEQALGRVACATAHAEWVEPMPFPQNPPQPVFSGRVVRCESPHRLVQHVFVPASGEVQPVADVCRGLCCRSHTEQHLCRPPSATSGRVRQFHLRVLRRQPPVFKTNTRRRGRSARAALWEHTRKRQFEDVRDLGHHGPAVKSTFVYGLRGLLAVWSGVGVFESRFAHYCSGPHCCPTGMHSLQERLRGGMLKVGIGSCPSPPPASK